MESDLQDAEIPVTERIERMVDESARLIQTDIIQATQIAKRALKLARSSNDLRGRTMALWMMGFCHRLQAQHSIAKRYILKALELTEKVPDLRPRVENEMAQLYHGVAEYATALEWSMRALASARYIQCTSSIGATLYVKGGILGALGRYTEAVDHLLQGYAIAEQIDNRQLRLQVLSRLGSVYGVLGEFDKAFSIFTEMLLLARELRDVHMEHNALQGLGNWHLVEAEYDTALDYFHSGLVIARAMALSYEETMMLYSIADTHTRAGQYEPALRYYRQSVELAERIEAHHHYVMAVFGLAELAREQGNYAEALEYGLKALETIQRIQGYEIDIQRFLADLYERMDNPVEALRHYKRFLQLRDEIQGIEVRRRVAELQAQSDVEGAERRAVARQEEAERLQREIEESRREVTALSLQMLYQQDLIREIQDALGRATGVGGPEATPMLAEIKRRIAAQSDARPGWEQFESSFAEANPGFARALTERCGNLTPTELRICALLRPAMTSKQIAAMLHIEPQSVDIYRSRIRRKLNLTSGANLTVFLTTV